MTGEPSVEMKDLQAKTWCNLALSGMGIELYSNYLFCILCSMYCEKVFMHTFFSAY